MRDSRTSDDRTPLPDRDRRRRRRRLRPDLLGVVATGATQQACEREMRAAIAFHLEGLRDAGEPSQLSATYVAA